MIIIRIRGIRAYGPLYICICNAMTDRQVRAAIEAGATNWEAVHAYHGYSPNCGKCECEIFEKIVRQENPEKIYLKL